MFIEVFNQLFKVKDSLINDFELVKDKLFTPTNQEALSDLKRELEIVSELIKRHVESGTKDCNELYLSEYDKLVSRYKNIENKYNSIIETNEKRRIQNIEITKFIDELKILDTPLIEFDEILFHHIISKIVITKDGYAIFHIKNDECIKLEI